MCTNRIDAIDPAIQRRAAEVLSFGRPGATERHAIIAAGLEGTGISAQGIRSLVEVTGEQDGRPPFTFSDLTQRLLPNIALDAYPDKPITLARAMVIAQGMKASPAFGGAQ
jgi:SpoVK/Ycf46/Vps4 family AAA+-type ATPase